jgi:glycosyltransferase involved in cell wall biosynthesis/ubiquinone/menaquinone biosynthesis C-methylase UbiE
VHICTIIARNYLPAARVLATSFREHHPDGRVSVLVLDDLYGEVDPRLEPFEVVRLEDLGDDLADFHRMAALYGVMEFATSVKPWLIETLMRSGSPEVCYLDPDIEVFAPLDDLEAAAREHGIVLTPHATAPLPRDGKKTDETSILAAGIYNLGFIVVGQGGWAFLQFWKERLRRECVIDPEHMRFVDQRWVDFVPGMFDHVILRDPTINVAYWNLHHRRVSWNGRGYEVDGAPLRFFHFSGFSPRTPHLLSKHQGDRPRILLSDNPALSRLCEHYAEQLASQGFGRDSEADYGLSRMANGVPIDKFVHRLLRTRMTVAERPGGPGTSSVPDPFDSAGAQELTSWLNRAAPADQGPERLTLYQATLYALEPDLQTRFPDPQGSDFDAFQRWFRDEVLEGRLHGMLAPEGPLEPPDRTLSDATGDQTTPRRSVDVPLQGWGRSRRDLTPGINIAGYFRAELGIGEGARLTMAAVEAAGIPFTTVAYANTSSRQEHPFVSGARRQDFDTDLVVVNADQLDNFAQDIGPEFFANRYVIGQWAWELEEFPEKYHYALDMVDEVWAVSEFTRASIAAVTDKPVFAFPHPIVEPVVPSGIDRRHLGLPDGFLFLFCFDMFSSIERKNPMGVIEAFRRAFAPDTGPVLVVKAINGANCVEDLERLRLCAQGRDDIVIVDRYFDADENRALMACADCYVSLHRSEGFGLTMAEAMALGIPVIATGYSGNMDFMSADFSYLVPWTRVTVPPGADPYPAGSHWAEPDLDAAAAFMRHVFDHPEEAVEVGRRGREVVLREHSIEQRARFVRGRFDAIHASGPHRSEAHAARQTRSGAHGSEGARTSVGAAPVGNVGASTASSQPSTLTELASSRPDIDTSARLPRLARLVRRLTRRALRHQDEHQREINLAMAGAVEEVRQLAATLRAGLETTTTRAHDTARAHTRRLDSVDAALAGLEGRLGADPSFEDLQMALRQLHAIPDMGDPPPFATTDASGRPAIGYKSQGAATSETYADFEDVFRGPEDVIRERLRVYLPLLRDAAPVLDVGCGRGEMLDLLSETAVPATGVDLDTSMAGRARAKGHRVEIADAVEYLRGQVDESLGAVFSAQMVEHISFDDLRELLAQARRVLRPGGVLILETVNPHALQAFKAFWIDLTHRVPIYPEVLVAHCRSAGFEECLVMFPGGTGELERDRWTQGDYAVVARKKPS